MQYHYFPSCNFTHFFPQESEKVKHYLSERFGAEIVTCCHKSRNDFPIEDTALTICQSCSLMVRERESALGKAIEPFQTREINVFELLAQDELFPWPDLQGEEITLQDCFRAKDKPQLLDAVRTCLHKMNATIIELPDNRDKCLYDGRFLLRKPAPAAVNDAPHYFHEILPQYLHIMNKEEQDAWLLDYAKRFTTRRVVGYCNTCVTALCDVGVDAVHLAELMFAEI